MPLPFGKKIQVGNFEVLKFTRSLSRQETANVRRRSGLPAEARKHLSRSGLPFIKVSSISGSWSIEFSAVTLMYRYIDETKDTDALRNFFTMFFADTTTFGDQEYWDAKGKALFAYMKRIEAKKSSADEDAALLSEEQAYEESKERVESIRKEVSDED